MHMHDKARGSTFAQKFNQSIRSLRSAAAGDHSRVRVHIYACICMRTHYSYSYVNIHMYFAIVSRIRKHIIYMLYARTRLYCLSLFFSKKETTNINFDSCSFELCHVHYTCISPARVGICMCMAWVLSLYCLILLVFFLLLYLNMIYY
jgi:hypothetical protein